MIWSIPGSHAIFSKRAASSWLLFWFRTFAFGLVASLMSGCKQNDPVGQDSHDEVSAIGATPSKGNHGVVDQDFPYVKNGCSDILNGTKFLNPSAVVFDNRSSRPILHVHVHKHAGTFMCELAKKKW